MSSADWQPDAIGVEIQHRLSASAADVDANRGMLVAAKESISLSFSRNFVTSTESAGSLTSCSRLSWYTRRAQGVAR